MLIGLRARLHAWRALPWWRRLLLDERGNVTLNLGAGGASCGTDSAGGIDYQIVKVGHSAAGVAPTQTSTTNPLPVAPQVGATGTHANVAENIASTTLIAANAARLGWSIYNDSDSAVNIKFGAAASATSFAIRLLPRGFTSHRDFGGAVYTGIIVGIWDSAPGTAGHVSARTMELTA